MRGSWCGVSEPSTGRAPSTRRRSRRSRRGPSSTGGSGRPASTAWTSTSNSCDHDERQAMTMTQSSDSQNSVVIERVVDAPPEFVWQLWTEPEHFMAWYGPTGATIPVAKMDVRVGGCAPRVHGDADPQRGDADVVHRRVPRGRSNLGDSSTRSRCRTSTPTSCRRPTSGCPKGIPRRPRSSSSSKISTVARAWSDPRRHPRGFAGGGRVEHGVRQARRIRGRASQAATRQGPARRAAAVQTVPGATRQTCSGTSCTCSASGKGRPVEATR